MVLFIKSIALFVFVVCRVVWPWLPETTPELSLRAVQPESTISPIRVSRVVDGNTLVIPAPYLPYPLKPELLLRLYGIDTPETGWRTDCKEEQALASAASAFTRHCLLGRYSGCSPNYHVLLRKWDKYGGRILGDVYFPDSDALLSELLTNHSFAIPYSGRGPSHNWCAV